MVTRLWFALSLLFAVVMLLNYSSREIPSLSAFDWLVAFSPLLLGLALKIIGRYVVTGRLA
jgi:hypothetical protein